MSKSVIFYDQNGRHQRSSVDTDIDVIQTLDRLEQTLENNNHLRLVVCICGNNKSNIIEEIQRHLQVEQIRPCKEHGERETNPLFGAKVQDETTFTTTNGWELKNRLTLIKSCIQHRCDTQLKDELDKSRRIVRQSLSTYRSSTEVDETKRNPSNAYSESEETE